MRKVLTGVTEVVIVMDGVMRIDVRLPIPYCNIYGMTNNSQLNNYKQEADRILDAKKNLELWFL